MKVPRQIRIGQGWRRIRNRPSARKQLNRRENKALNISLFFFVFIKSQVLCRQQLKSPMRVLPDERSVKPESEVDDQNLLDLLDGVNGDGSPGVARPAKAHRIH